jgi:hypothetical protein
MLSGIQVRKYRENPSGCPKSVPDSHTHNPMRHFEEQKTGLEHLSPGRLFGSGFLFLFPAYPLPAGGAVGGPLRLSSRSRDPLLAVPNRPSSMGGDSTAPFMEEQCQLGPRELFLVSSPWRRGRKYDRRLDTLHVDFKSQPLGGFENDE